ncbi:hypothetical protein Atai01_79580 [Amycolatopsis taiwanensis]|uniref:Uncharacterized protein n=1 Tax=Amycolatopsis taiwanensis TaxID=342230 RepID=A0A9W6R962_9PSEU|nr:hypothetical protein Atai01_79580 [Amycolatopsis taiwanensis]
MGHMVNDPGGKRAEAAVQMYCVAAVTDSTATHARAQILDQWRGSHSTTFRGSGVSLGSDRELATVDHGSGDGHR